VGQVEKMRVKSNWVEGSTIGQVGWRRGKSKSGGMTVNARNKAWGEKIEDWKRGLPLVRGGGVIKVQAGNSIRSNTQGHAIGGKGGKGLK